MAASRSIIAIASLILLAAGVLFQLFVVLSGGVHGSPINKFYFLEASTNAIPGAPHPNTAWTFFATCGITGTTTHDCNKSKAALPFRPDQNFGTTTGVPPSIAGSKKYYYLSRFMFAFYLIALLFAGIGLIAGLLAICTRLGSFLSSALTMVAMFFQALGAALMTAWTVEGRDDFRKAGHTASLGKYSYGFSWAALACFFLSTVLFCVAGSVGKNKGGSGKRGGFGRNRSTRSTGGSFGDGNENGGVKSEYS